VRPYSVRGCRYTFGSVLLEPILLFVTLYYIGIRFERQVPLVNFLAGLVVAVAIGRILELSVGTEHWIPPAHFSAVSNVGVPVALLGVLYWRMRLEPSLRGL